MLAVLQTIGPAVLHVSSIFVVMISTELFLYISLLI